MKKRAGKKLRIGLIFGGKSAEHEVSLQSARNIIEVLDKNKYETVLIGIDKKGLWHLHDQKSFLLNESNPNLIALNKNGERISVVPERQANSLVSLEKKNSVGAIDVVFPILHGPFGEDGSIQGMLKLMDIPYVGSGILGSAVGMDKEITKRLLKEAGIPVGKFMCLKNPKETTFEKVKKELGLPLFVKPVNMGSSVGVSKVTSKNEFKKALELAFSYDRKVLIEAAIEGREIECAVLGNENPIASVLGEIAVTVDFYSYEAKYIDENGASLIIPASVSHKISEKIQRLAIQTFKVLGLEGMARIDFFLKSNGEVFVNEANTIPGFTKISMYPKLWEKTGISYSKLLDILIKLAIERYKKDKKLKTSY